MPIETKEREKLVTLLPDFLSIPETEAFVEFLEAYTERYAVKTLLHHSTMILNHRKRIDYHTLCAQKLLPRVNGEITPIQRKAYDVRIAETVARKFYSSMSNEGLLNELRKANLDVTMNTRMTGRCEWVEVLVRDYVERAVKDAIRE